MYSALIQGIMCLFEVLNVCDIQTHACSILYIDFPGKTQKAYIA